MRAGRLLMAFILGASLAQAEESPVSPSTSTTKASRSKQGVKPLKKIKEVGEKVLTPNPKFQDPAVAPMPPQAPKTPKLEKLPPETAPTRAERFFRAASNVMTSTWNNNIFVWLPAISTDPNTGPTVGIMPVLVLSDAVEHHIRHLLAPSYTYNSLFKQTVTARYYYYPTDASQLYAVGSYSQETNRELKIRYEDSELLGGRIFIRSEAFYDVDGSQRFFGVGPDTRESNEAGYTGHDHVARADLGVNFLGTMRASAGLRFRSLGITENIIPDVDNLATVFPAFADQQKEDVVAQNFRLLWDNRDLPVTPSKGNSGEIFFEKTTRGWGSDADYLRYGVDGRRFVPWKGGKQITALHFLFDQANGSNIPFYELTALGGKDSLRGFGEGRFLDRGRILFNIEQRIELTSLALMGVVTRFEVGPFVDLGTVFPRAGDMQVKDVRPVFGGAFRAAVKPNVVGSVDVGVGNEGVGVYVGINYPF